MNALDAIFSRRSIRQYTAKPVPHDMVADIVRAAMYAPSAGNERPWHFIILTDRALLDEIPKFHPYAAMLRHASTAVLICGGITLEQHTGCWMLDCAAATQTMLLAAHAKGLGAVWCGVYPLQDRVEHLRALLHLPKQIVPFSLIPLGFPAEEKMPADRFDASRIHDNRW